MKLQNIKAIFGITLLAGLFLFGSCSNGSDAQKNEGPKEFIITGTLSSGLGAGGRSATSSFSYPSGSQIVVTAYKGTASSYDQDSAVTGELGGGVGYITYTLKLTSAGDWFITASVQLAAAQGESPVIILYGEKEVDVPELTSADDIGRFTVPAIVMTADTSDAGTKGSVDLKIFDESDSLKQVRVTGLTNELQTLYFENEGTSSIAKLQQQDITPGAYEVTFIFEDNSGKTVYTCTEAITVFAGLTTDTWSYEQSRFAITTAMLQKQSQSPDLKTPVVLWNVLGKEKGLTVNSPYSVSAYEESTSFTKNMGVFGLGCDENYIVFENTSTPSSKAPVFCFDNEDDTSVYVLEEGDYYHYYLHRYRPSYSKFLKDDNTNFDLTEIVNTAFGISGNRSFNDALAFYDGTFYFFFYVNTGDNQGTYLGAFDIDTQNLAYTIFENPGTITALSVDAVDGELIISYIKRESEDNIIWIRGIEYDGSTLSFTELSDSLSVGTIDIDFAGYSYGKCVASDVQILNDVLYIAIYSVPHNDGPYANAWFSGVRKPIMLSNGGIAKVNLIKDDPNDLYSFDDWKNGSKILGWYTGVYEDEDGEEQAAVTLQPPFEERNKYFYGARKFIAVAPNALIVADDGGFVDIILDDTNGENKGKPTQINQCVNMNRIVTINLSDEDETISAQDVPVSFDATFAAMESPFFYGIQR